MDDHPMSIEHELKVWPDFYPAIEDGSKGFELRRDDRGFRVGDTLALREFHPEDDHFCGRGVLRAVTYVLRAGDAPGFGLQEGFCILGLGPVQ